MRPEFRPRLEAQGLFTASSFQLDRSRRLDDAAFKKLFSHPRLIELLIRRHVPEWHNVLAVQTLIEHDKELGRGERQLAVESLVLHHGDRQWNVPTRLRELFRDSAPDTYRVVEPLPPDAPPPGPLDLPQMILGLAGVAAETDMMVHVPTLRRVVEGCGDEDFDRFMARGDRVSARLGCRQTAGEPSGPTDAPAPPGCPQVRERNRRRVGAVARADRGRRTDGSSGDGDRGL